MFKNQVIELTEQNVNKETREIIVYINQFPIGKIDLYPIFSPMITLTEDFIVIWGGYKLHVFSLSGKEEWQHINDDQILFVYKIHDLLCIVCETSLKTYSIDNWRELYRFDHLEIILSSVWVDEKLMIKDLQDIYWQIIINPETGQISAHLLKEYKQINNNMSQ